MLNLPAWITIKESPIFPKWKIVDFEYIAVDTPCNNGSTNVYVRTEDKNGVYQAGIKVYQAWPDDRAVETMKPLKDAVEYCGQKYGASYFQSGDSSFDPAKGQRGPYSFYADGVSDEVSGLGLPLKRHVQYRIVFRWTDQPTPPPVTGHWVVGNPNNIKDPQLKWVE